MCYSIEFVFLCLEVIVGIFNLLCRSFEDVIVEDLEIVEIFIIC